MTGGNEQLSARVESWRGFQAQLLQCWAGEAITHVTQRAVSSSNDVQSIALVSLLSDRQEDDDGAAFTNISAFVTQFFKTQHARRCGEGGGKERGPGTQLHVASVPDASGFKQWLESHHHEQQLLSQDHQPQDATCLVILYAPLVSVEKQEEIAQIVVATGNTGMTRTLLLMINDLIGLMDVDCDSSSSSSSSSPCYRFVDSHAATTGDESSLSIQSTRRFLVRPLKQLGSQCGLRFVMEIARWTVFKEEIGGATSSTTTEPRPPAMLASVSQMPFQLLLLALRWSHFHPALVRAFAKPFERKLRLIPQHRIREAICQLRTQEMALWSHLESGFQDPLGQVLTLPNRRRLSTAPEIAIPIGEENKLKRSLSECQLWDVQKQFYLAQGIRAWSDGIIPFGVSSSSFLAAAYARVAVDFFLEAAGTTNGNFDTGDAPNCFVWEAASGSCKFLHAFLVHFYQLIEGDQAAHEFARRGLRPCVVASDLSDQVLDSRLEMACFQPLLQNQRLDFARFDTAVFTRGENKKQLFLRHSKKIWHVGRDGPVFLMGNYFLDSLRADVFAVTKSTATSASSVSVDAIADPVKDTQIKVFEGRVDRQITSIADMELSFQQIDPSTKAVYNDLFVNQVFTDILERIKSTPASTQPSSLILFPVEAIQFIRTLVDTSTINTTGVSCSRSGFPVGIVIGDASFSFRDPIPSAFFNQEDGGGNEFLEIPQLSPHPDCFCLPVDFEILRLFLQRLTSPSSRPVTSAQVASAIATDTFDVLYGRICPPTDERLARADHEDVIRTIIQPPTSGSSLRPSSPLSPSQVAFAQEFASFTPSDCDLLWGMMGVDDGAAHFSPKTQIALLAQSAWDFDLFVVLQWKLMRLWRRMLPMAAETTGSTEDPKNHQQMRLQLIAVANKCWRTFYSLDGESSNSGEVFQALSLLQLCRWLYELKAYGEVILLLSESIKRTPKLEANVSICYLLALAYFYSGDLWRALVYFRKCFAMAPTRVKFRRRIVQTLLALQRQKLQERENRCEE